MLTCNVLNLIRPLEGKDQESIQPKTKPDPGQHMGSDNITRKQHTQECQEAKWPQGCKGKDTTVYKDKQLTNT